MHSIINELLTKNESFSTLKHFILDKKTPLLVTGVLDTQKMHLVSTLESELTRPSLIIAQNEAKAKEIYEDLHFFMRDNIVHYPSKDIIFYSADVKSVEIIKKRLQIMSRIISGERLNIVLSIESLFDKLVPKEILKDSIINISIGDTISIDEFAEKLVFMGYERTELVEGQGQFAIRGGIIDIFGATMDKAVRIELWDDEVDSIRTLDAFSQRSIDKTDSITVFPVKELVYNQEILDIAVENIKICFEKTKKVFIKNGKKEELERLNENIKEAIEKLEIEKNFSGVDKYIQFFYGDDCLSLLDYLSEDTIIYFDEVSRIQEHSENVYNEFKESVQSRILKGYMLSEQTNMVFTYHDILKSSDRFTQILLSGLSTNVKDFNINEIVHFNIKSSKILKNNFQMLEEELQYFTSMKYKIIFLAGSRTRCERLLTELNDKEIRTNLLTEDIEDLIPGIVYISRGTLHRSFEYPEDKFVIITDKEIFTEVKKQNKSKKAKKGAAIESFTDLKLGDYVVHDNYGIGVFNGIEKILKDGINKDYLKLSYADEGILYVAINQMDMIQKYIGGDTAKVKLNKLGTQNWAKSKSKAKKAVEDIAKELLEVYAKRQASVGFSYSEDTVWQTEFEESFPYDETEDQLTAISDVKEDMQSNKVMDRLICGDVGFGKTEIAIRGAFKAVQDGKQVAFLVPTTILAQQHYATFIQRMQDFPIEVELLSRFRTPAQQKRAIEGLKTGKVDIVIGTHRILSKDLKFKDLGLIIIDEEQRFGVKHKDKFKTLKENVDILTLTATPIPRTLHMSMTGIRDMSVLEEPPGERIPIQTYVMEYEPEFIKDAINRELTRGGQVYFLHNRVNNIDEVCLRVQSLVPDATVAFAHGQMSERELENVMMNFIEGNIDVLVCTTIIETGLDIPNVNTIIIQDADRMGLSQLYQLRGRVGRSNRTSFAYLLYKKDKVLKEISEKRLQTIREFTEFGSGFKIAMRDLEIRGAGNLFGAEQHGHMDTVGYDMYCRLLDESIRRLKGEEIIPEFETLIDMSINAYIPSTYIKNEEQKLEMYKKISIIKSETDFYDVQDELEDRFSTLPNAVQNLLDIAILKATAHNLGVISIIQKGNKINLNFKEDNKINIDKLTEVLKSNKYLSFNGVLTYTKEEQEVNFLKNLRLVLETLS